MKNRIWIIIFSVIIVLSLAVYLFISNSFSGSSTVGIYKDGELVEKIDIKTVTEKKELSLKSDGKENVIFISNNHIKMLSADCPDKTCIKHGELKAGGTPIICLPNKVIIKWETGSDEYDVRTGGSE